MKTNNNTTRIVIFLGIMLATFGIAKLDTKNLSFDYNMRPYLMFAAAIMAFLFAFYRIRKEKVKV